MSRRKEGLNRSNNMAQAADPAEAISSTDTTVDTIQRQFEIRVVGQSQGKAVAVVSEAQLGKAVGAALVLNKEVCVRLAELSSDDQSAA